MLIKILTPNFKHSDERGFLVQLVRKGYKQMNIDFSKAGVFRGNHYHALNNEAFYVILGKFQLVVELEGIREEYRFSQGDMFEIPPNVVHSFNYLEDTYLAALYDKGVEFENGSKDIIGVN